MHRVIAVLSIPVLPVVGAYAIVRGGGGLDQTYRVPAEPTMVALLVGGLAVVAILVVVAGGGLAFVFNVLSRQLTQQGPGAPGDAKPPAESVAPYVPAYSYKEVPDNVEVRQWLVASAVGVVLLVLIVLVNGGSEGAAEAARAFGLTEWLVGAGSVVVIVGATAAAGVGLAFWFYRTHQEAARAAGEGPMWPSAEWAALESKLKLGALLGVWQRMTFLDKLLIAVNVGFVLTVLAIVAVWVVPGVQQVASVDQARFAAAAPAATAAAVAPGEVTASGSAGDLQKELAALPPGTAAAGQATFAGQACAACHLVDSEATVVGPSLAGIGAKASTRRPGYSAELYLYESIVRPGAHVVEGFADGIMPANFKEILTAQQLSDLVAYLASLK